MNLQTFLGSSVERLSVHYPAQEAKAIAVRLLKETLQGYKGYEHLVEPERELDTFSAIGAVDGGAESFLVRCVERSVMQRSFLQVVWSVLP